ncbi:MAG: SBBP repeat-containing protein [Actinomycetota bacterium]|nr:SBBP repeat-containing protein [Actinomycetota bacterium]
MKSMTALTVAVTTLILTFPGTATARPTITYSTYVGDRALALAGDVATYGGNTYITGTIDTAGDFDPKGGFQQAPGGGYDAFVAGYGPKGQLLFASYLGGIQGDDGEGIATDAAGNIYVTGGTQSPDFPTEDPEQPIIKGGQDAFVAKISADGSQLLYSTFLGGSDGDSGQAIAVDGTGAMYVTGDTFSLDFPTRNAPQKSFAGEGDDGGDGFVTKLSSDGSTIDYSTYLGGGFTDTPGGITVDKTGSAYVAGYTSSSNFPVTGNGPHDSGHSDGFATKLAPDGSVFVYSGLIGGPHHDSATGIAVDDAGHAYLSGYAQGGFPVKGGYQMKYARGEDAFAVKLTTTGAIARSTYLGGADADEGTDVALDERGRVYLVGWTNSKDFPLVRAVDKRMIGADSFVTVLSPHFSTLSYSTFFGGSKSEGETKVAVDGDNTYVIGQTRSKDLATVRANQSRLHEIAQCYAMKITRS